MGVRAAALGNTRAEGGANDVPSPGASRLTIDSLVRGKAGIHDHVVEGRVFSVRPTYVAVIGTEDGKQWVIYEPEVVGPPRPVHARKDIPEKLR
jgi:hypothetical protein